MLWSSYSEGIDRPEREAVAAFFGEREFHLLTAIAPRIVAGLGLKAPEVRCTLSRYVFCLCFFPFLNSFRNTRLSLHLER